MYHVNIHQQETNHLKTRVKPQLVWIWICPHCDEATVTLMIDQIDVDETRSEVCFYCNQESLVELPD